MSNPLCKLIVIFSLPFFMLVQVFAQEGLQVVSTKKVYKMGTNIKPITVKIRSGKRTRTITLIGRKSDAVLFTEKQDGLGTRFSLPIDKIDELVFDLKIDELTVYRYTSKKDWHGAVQYLSPIVKPTLDYLDIPDNNAVEAGLRLGVYMMKDAQASSLQAKTDEQNRRAKNKYVYAYNTLKKVALAKWSPVSDLAELRKIECLLALKKPKTAARNLSYIQEPEISDIAYGRYWLDAARIQMAKRNYREALDAAVKSICFQNKDIETFPDALLISAQCYEELQNWYRARDVYYEVARIFPGTEWSKIATRRLRFIMQKGFTAKKEVSPIQNVFFGVNENMNEIIKEFLENKEKSSSVERMKKKKEPEKIDLLKEEE